MAKAQPTAYERFMQKVRRTETCWIWTGSRLEARGGYGRFRYDGKPRFAHRWIYEYVHGPVPDGLFVCHSCDVPACVNPEHLFLGTNSDNMRDCARKGRLVPQRHPERSFFVLNPDRVPHKRGEENHAAKLTENAVREMRRRFAAGESITSIANSFAVARSAASRVLNGTTWRHVQ